MSSETMSLFDKFPIEIRNEIYGMVVETDTEITIQSDHSKRYQSPVPVEVVFATAPGKAIFQLNQKFRAEAIAIFFRSNSFNIVGKAALVNFIDVVGSAGSSNIQYICIGTCLPQRSELPHHSDDSVHRDMIEKLYDITTKGDEECGIPEHVGLNEAVASLATWKQLKSVAIEYTASFAEFSAIENEYLHLLGLFMQHKGKGALTLTMSRGIEDVRTRLFPTPKPKYEIVLPDYLGDDVDFAALRWLFNEVHQILTNNGNNVRLDMIDPYAYRNAWYIMPPPSNPPNGPGFGSGFGLGFGLGPSPGFRPFQSTHSQSPRNGLLGPLSPPPWGTSGQKPSGRKPDQGRVQKKKPKKQNRRHGGKFSGNQLGGSENK